MEKKQKKKSKFREIRSAVTMMCVMVAMMSTATYAWFTLTDSPTVTGLEMTAASASGLKVSTDNSTWYDAVQLTNLTGSDELVPVSLKTKEAKFYTPVYTGNEVTALAETALSDAGLKGYVAKSEFYVKADAGTGEVNVGIITIDPKSETNKDKFGVTNNQANAVGSFVRQKDTTRIGNTAIKAVRVMCEVTDSESSSTVFIYEPNWEDTVDGGTAATNSIAANDATAANVVSLFDNGEIKTGALSENDKYTSERLFTVGETGKKVTMYIWIEGTDVDCVDEIMKDVIQAQLQFKVVSKVTANP